MIDTDDMCVRCGHTEAEHPGATFTNDHGTWECPRFEPFALARVNRILRRIL